MVVGIRTASLASPRSVYVHREGLETALEAVHFIDGRLVACDVKVSPRLGMSEVAGDLHKVHEDAGHQHVPCHVGGEFRFALHSGVGDDQVKTEEDAEDSEADHHVVSFDGGLPGFQRSNETVTIVCPFGFEFAPSSDVAYIGGGHHICEELGKNWAKTDKN